MDRSRLWHCKRTSILIGAENNNNNHDNNRHSNHDTRDQNIWFTEWSENKIAKVNANDKLEPFSVVSPSSVPHNNEVTIKRGDSKEIKVKVIPEEFHSFSPLSGNMNIHMIASGTFTPTGDLGILTGEFSEEWLSFIPRTIILSRTYRLHLLHRWI